jgi:hypothetical protein
MMNVKNSEAVVVDQNSAVLEVSYKIIRGSEEYSDCNRFHELLHGREDLGEVGAVKSVLEQAKSFANNLRAEGWEVSCWDAAGRCY